MQTTITEFNSEFGTNEQCLRYVFKLRFPRHRGYYYYAPSKAFVNKKGKYIFPLAGTIFAHSRTPITKWFYAMFLFYSSKNGVSGKELQRQLGVTYKCAWRIGHQIRSMMKQGDKKLSGIVEADETYIGGRAYNKYRYHNKTMVLGLKQRGGEARAKVEIKENHRFLNNIYENVEKGSTIMSDEAHVYKRTAGKYEHLSINHGKKEYAREEVSTNSIEGLWSQMKRSWTGTHHWVSSQHLQKYVDEQVWQHNHRGEPFHSLLKAL